MKKCKMQNAKCKIEGEKVENAIETKSLEFAVRIVNLYKHLTESKKGYPYLVATAYLPKQTH